MHSTTISSTTTTSTGTISIPGRFCGPPGMGNGGWVAGTLAAFVAAAAQDDFAGLHDHPFPTCFVCGPERRPDDAFGPTGWAHHQPGGVALLAVSPST